MTKRIDLVKGDVLKTLITLSLPILGTSFIQMAYSLVDMLWIGRVGSAAVAAVGTAGFFAWFGNSLVLVSKTGAEVGVSQAIGKGDIKKRDKYINNSLILCVMMAIIYSFILLIFREQLIGFFKLGDENIIQMSIQYLVIISISMVCAFLNPQFTGIITATGNSKTPFLVNTVGLVVNIVLDPIFIFGMGPIPKMGVAGAALATALAQVVVTILFIRIFVKGGYKLNLKGKVLDFAAIKEIAIWGIPSAVQNCLFAFFAMIIGRLVASFGATAIAVQKVGSQIESISWMTAGGFSSALTAFVGQNYGAKAYDRVRQGYKSTIFIASMLGVFATLLLVFGGQWLFSIFLPEQEAILKGADYLRILGYSQIFMCIEITTSGAFFGVGKTMPPSIIGVIFTGLRIPMAMLLAKPELLGLDGIWWSISISSVIKGILLVGLFAVMVLIPLKKKSEKKIEAIA